MAYGGQYPFIIAIVSGGIGCGLLLTRAAIKGFGRHKRRGDPGRPVQGRAWLVYTGSSVEHNESYVNWCVCI